MGAPQLQEGMILEINRERSGAGDKEARER
jgi:hypothetical protein